MRTHYDAEMAISTKAPSDATAVLAAVTCPKCGSSIPITEALSQQARDQVGREYELKRQALEKDFSERERKVNESRAEIESAKAKLNEEVAARLTAEKAQMTATLRKELDAQKAHELTALKEQLDRKNQQMEEANQKQLELMRQKSTLEDKERNLRLEMAQQLDAAKSKLNSEVAARVENEKAALTKKLSQELEQKNANDLAALREQLESRNKQIADANAKQLELLRQKAALEDRDRNLQLELARQLDAERAKVAEQARATALEESRLKMLEKDKQADDLRRQIETLQQKANQGSVQAQGEILELDFEAKLRGFFPMDEIAPVASGQKGADVQQIVRTSLTNLCGTILWEAKRTRNWSAAWVAKLKADQREAQAEIAVIVTQALPKEVTTFGCVEGVWVTSFECALPLAVALRQGLLQTAAARQAQLGKAGKMEQLYEYLTGAEFRQKIEGIVDAFTNMRKDLEAERTAMERIWAKREKQLRMALDSTAKLYGDVQGVLGSAALPDVATLALPAAE